ncbi:MAG: protein-L-isoaspartate(D-aspartate) O-methyltransferase [Promethearchaeota archaeon]
MKHAEKKLKLVERLEMSGYITSPLVRDAMLTVPREAFMPERIQDRAYVDTPQPIGDGQTISAPHMNAMMCSGLKLDGTTPLKLLEIGTGSGYHATLCGEILRNVHPESHVYTVERIPALGTKARGVIDDLGYSDIITVIISDGTRGYPEQAPYHRILVTAAAPSIPKALTDQLADGGLMLIPVGNRRSFQKLVEIRKIEGKIIHKDICGVVFVPLIGEDGFDE